MNMKVATPRTKASFGTYHNLTEKKNRESYGHYMGSKSEPASLRRRYGPPQFRPCVKDCSDPAITPRQRMHVTGPNGQHEDSQSMNHSPET